ncbi:MAG: 50S ribosomal protein L30 [Synergistetes bacterium]|nr:50S ribosomal protein L30 [Synergistota bacterium]MCX8128088.1 50S ribosomal protein L30 [Synergistota bacterium]MDW8192464.1 50S ribosomal protein L30 [Synergistota bacterium]
MKTLKIKWVKSFVGYSQDQRDTIRALGFRKLNQVIEKPDIPQIRGMIKKVHHLIEIEEG